MAEILNGAKSTYVLIKKDTANAIPIVIASSLLIANLGPELGLVSSASSAPCNSAEPMLNSHH